MSRNYNHYQQGDILNLSGENLSKKVDENEIPAICNFLNTHPEIHTLKLDHNDLLGRPIAGSKKLLTEYFLDVPTLFHLDLSHNKLSEDTIVPLARGKFLTLNISYNHFGNSEHKNRIYELATFSEIESSAHLFAKNKILVELDISGNDLSAWYLNKLLNNRHLSILNIKGNNIDATILHSLRTHKTISRYDYDEMRQENFDEKKGHRCTIM